MATVTISETKMSKDRSRRTWSEARTSDQKASPPPTQEEETGVQSPHDPNPQMPVDKEREMKIRPYTLKIKAAKGVLTRHINDAKRSITAILSKEPEMPSEGDINDMRQHLSDIRSAHESIVTTYTNIMCVDIPLMTETYEKNLDEQLERAITFERDLKNGINRYEMEMAKRAKSDSGSSQTGFHSPRYQFDTCLLYTSDAADE